jgi:hypothetical protein
VSASNKAEAGKNFPLNIQLKTGEKNHQYKLKK